MPVRKGQLVGAKNGMYGKRHAKAARKKMSDAVRKAYAEGRLEGMSEYCRKLGVIAAKKKHEEETELWSNKIISYIMWLFDHTFIVDGIDVLTEIVNQAMNKDEEIPF